MRAFMMRPGHFLMTALATSLLMPLPLRLASAQGGLMQTAPHSGEWRKVHTSRVRMIAGAPDFAGLQLQMQKGWKTYWRSPGDTGVAPSFDWTGSENLKHAEVLFPAPHKYQDAYSTSIGYKHEVVLPVRIVAKDPRKPVKVKLNFGYGLCEQICIPGEVKLRLTMPSNGTTAPLSGNKALLAAYQKKVPHRVLKPGQSANGFAIDKVTIKLDGDKPYIAVEATTPPGLKTTDLYVEGPKGFYLPMATAKKRSAKGKHRFHIDLTEGDEPMELDGRTLSMTLTGDGRGIEYRHKIY